MELAEIIIHFLMIGIVIYILYFLTAAKIWSEIGLPPVFDYEFYKKIQEKMRPIGYRLPGYRANAPGRGRAATRKSRIGKI